MAGLQQPPQSIDLREQLDKLVMELDGAVYNQEREKSARLASLAALKAEEYREALGLPEDDDDANSYFMMVELSLGSIEDDAYSGEWDEAKRSIEDAKRKLSEMNGGRRRRKTRKGKSKKTRKGKGKNARATRRR